VTAVLIIPALNEAPALQQVLREIPLGVFGEIIVVDNG
jgi:glycosyltransferase involved in cell wall biosynthesis